MPTLHEVKVFSDNLTTGNLAGVVSEAGLLSDNEMQAIAKSVGASETAFLLPSDIADIKVRWFAPSNEVGICIHATIAALGVLQSINTDLPSPIRVETKNTILTCYLEENQIVVQFSDYKLLPEPVDLKKVLHLFPLNSTEIIGFPKIIEIFDDKELMIEVESFEILSKLQPDQANYLKICEELEITGISIFTRDAKDLSNHIHTRESAPKYGYLEDPLCGMAAGAINKYLKTRKKIQQITYPSQLKIEQGYFCNTSGVILVEEKNGNSIIGYSYAISSLKNEFNAFDDYKNCQNQGRCPRLS